MDPEVNFSKEYCLNLEKSLKNEWIETDGKGGFASSTLVGCSTRKYHGLLVLPLKDKPAKYVLLSKMEAVLKGDKTDFHLSTNKYPKVYYPTGHKYIEQVSLGLCPTTRYKIGEVEIEASVIMPRQGQVTVLKYTVLSSPKSCTLHFLPLLAYRDFHQLAHENMHLQVKVFTETNDVYKIEPYQGMPPLYLTTDNKSVFYPSPTWNRNLEYLEERERGYPYQEDLFNPGIIERKLKAGESFYIAASIEPLQDKPSALFESEIQLRQAATQKGAPLSSSPKDGAHASALSLLVQSIPHYLIKNLRGHLSVTAGYHWFGEWGRDTLISLPGLTLGTGRVSEAWDVLKAFARHERGGLLPNMLGQTQGADAYNSIDAPLWYFWALHHYLQAEPQAASKVVSEIGSTLLSIFNNYVSGINGLVACQENGLLTQGNENTQLTWMDAIAYGRPVTPRHGYAVEINALWLLALYTLQGLSQKGSGFSSAQKKQITLLYSKAKTAFVPLFYHPEYHYLADVVTYEGHRELGVRPNQLIAVVLPDSPLSKEQKISVVNRCTEELLTPYGLRTLSPRNPQYKPVCAGSSGERDSAYHQGTVWPWWVGIYTEAYLSAHGDTKKNRSQISHSFAPLWDEHLYLYGIGGISEIFDGNPPHTPRGCAFQAWSVAESIRALELIKEQKP